MISIKKIYGILIGMLLMTISVSAQKADWKEMHSFHSIISNTFHPAEEGNLKPVKDSVNILLGRAKAWHASKTPQGFNPLITKPVLKKLVVKCTELKKAVKSGSDDKILTKLITEAHDIFHAIMKKCGSPTSAHH